MASIGFSATTLLLLLPLLCSVSQAAVKERNNDLYYVHEQEKSLADATDYCDQLGGRIAGDFAADDHALFSEFRSSIKRFNPYFWVGGVNTRFDNKRYFWISSGQPVPQQLFAPGHPKCEADCGTAFGFVSWTQSGLYGSKRSDRKYFVCRFDLNNQTELQTLAGNLDKVNEFDRQKLSEITASVGESTTVSV